MRSVFVLVVILAACGKPAAAPHADDAKSAKPSETTHVAKEESAKPEPYQAAAWSGDVVMRWIRPERSSRLAQVLPKGRAREAWSATLDAKLAPEFVAAVGTRIVVVGHASRYAIFDTRGMPVASGVLEGDRVRVDPAAGILSAGGRATRKLADGAEGAPGEAPLDLTPGAHDAEYGQTTVYATANALEIRDGDTQRVRQIVQGAFEPLDLAIDGDGVIHAIVRQGTELSLWITPVRGGSIGRVRLPNARRDRASVPPILGRMMKVIVLDDRLVALAPDGKTLFEKRGALTGGASMTSDDRLLVATDEKLYALDAAGKASDIASAKGVVFVTPPILASGAMLLVASGSKLHAFTFEP